MRLPVSAWLYTAYGRCIFSLHKFLVRVYGVCSVKITNLLDLGVSFPNLSYVATLNSAQYRSKLVYPKKTNLLK
jgi:hypothetical protein